MPRSVTKYRVFIASPSGLQDELAAIKRAIHEINRSKQHIGIELEDFNGSEDAVPDLGSYPQDVITQQLLPDTDVFICVMGTRIGTPTPIAQSGTVEEWENAISLRRRRGNWPKILMYFSVSPVNPDEIDLGQLARVREFQELAARTGILYQKFDSSDALETLARIHLNQVVAEIESQNFSTPRLVDDDSAQRTSAAEIFDDDDDDDFGLYDSADLAEQNIGEIGNIMHRLTEAIDELTSRINESTSEIDQAKKSDPDVSPKKMKFFVNRVAAHLTNFNQRIEGDIGNFARVSRDAVDSSIKMIEITEEDVLENENFSKEDYEDFRGARDKTLGSVIEMMNATSNSIQSISDLRMTVAGLGRLTREFNIAKRKTVQLLTLYEASMSEFRTVLETLADRMKQLAVE